MFSPCHFPAIPDSPVLASVFISRPTAPSHWLDLRHIWTRRDWAICEGQLNQTCLVSYITGKNVPLLVPFSIANACPGPYALNEILKKSIGVKQSTTTNRFVYLKSSYEQKKPTGSITCKDKMPQYWRPLAHERNNPHVTYLPMIGNKSGVLHSRL